jgi:hypothetical protein
MGPDVLRPIEDAAANVVAHPLLKNRLITDRDGVIASYVEEALRQLDVAVSSLEELGELPAMHLVSRMGRMYRQAWVELREVDSHDPEFPRRLTDFVEELCSLRVCLMALSNSYRSR